MTTEYMRSIWWDLLPLWLLLAPSAAPSASSSRCGSCTPCSSSIEEGCQHQITHRSSPLQPSDPPRRQDVFREIHRQGPRRRHLLQVLLLISPSSTRRT